VALELEPEGRYATAAAMEQAIRDGAHGIAPPGFEPRDTAATRIIAPAAPTSETRALTSSRRAPQQVPARRPAPPPVAPGRRPATAAPAAQRGRGLRRLGVLLAVLVVLAAGAAIVAASSDSGGSVHLKPIVTRDAQQAIQQLQDLIDNNTR